MSVTSLDCWTGVNADKPALGIDEASQTAVGVVGELEATLDSAVVTAT